MAVTRGAIGMAIAGQCMADEDGVVGLGRQLSPGLVGHLDVDQRLAALQHQRTPTTHRGELSSAHRVTWTPCPGDREVGGVGSRMDGTPLELVDRRVDERVNGGSVVARQFFRHVVCLHRDIQRARRRQRDRRASRRTLCCPFRGHIPTVTGGRAPWVSVPGCRTRLTGPLVMSSP